MLTLFKREGSPYWCVRGTVHRQRVYASTKETEKAGARRFKEALEIRLVRPAGECHVVTFREAAGLYLEARPRVERKWVIAIERLCGAIGDRLLADIRQAVLVDAANTRYPHCLEATKNKNVFGPAAAVLHYAVENDLCSHVRIKRLKERDPEPRALRREDADRLIAVADGKMRLLLVVLFAQGWRISDTLRLLPLP